MNLFAHPWALALLPVVPLVLWVWRRRPRTSIAWPGASELAPLATKSIGHWQTGLRGLALATGIVGLAGPRWPLPGDRLESEGIAIMFVVDVSGSMAEPDFEAGDKLVPRLEAVRTAFRELLARRKLDRIGLVLFATHPESTFPLTLDHAAIDRALAAASPRGTPMENETNLGDAIVWGLKRLRVATGRSVMIVCSDGEHNVPAPAFTPRQAGQLAAAAGVPVYTVFAGPPAGSGQAALEAVARMTGGASFAASNTQALADANAAIDTLERGVASSERVHKYQHGDHWLALAAFAILGLMLALDRGPWLTIP